MTPIAALDPWRVRGTRWWAERNRRERALLTLLAALLALAAVLILLVRPLQTMRARALADLRTYDTIEARILAAGPAPAIAPARRTGATAAIVAAGAPSFGIVAERVQSAGGMTRLHVAPVGYDALIHWLADLARTSDVRVERLAIRRGALPGTVTADLVLAR